jgi:hypothetical protein
MRRAERGRLNRSRIKVVIGPLSFLRIIANECDRNIVPVKNGSASFQFRDHRKITVKTCLARPPEMLRNRAHKATVQIEMGQASVLSIANEQKRLIITDVK